MPEGESGPLARARRELAEARALAEAGFHRIACVQAYYAAFYAVEDAQAATAERVSKTHGGAVAALGRMAAAVNDAEVGRLFAQLRTRREKIHYADAMTTPEEAQNRLAAAERVIGVVERYLTETSSGGGADSQPGP